MACLAAAICTGICAAGCSDEPEPTPIAPVVTAAELASGGFEEVLACRASHEHDLRYVRIVANAAAVAMYRRCILVPAAGCSEPFPVGALFVKYEYELPGCFPGDFDGYTASLKLAPGSYPEGHDWRWQRLTPKFRVTEDGAPLRCLLCHIDHCAAPAGHDLHCLPD